MVKKKEADTQVQPIKHEMKKELQSNNRKTDVTFTLEDRLMSAAAAAWGMSINTKTTCHKKFTSITITKLWIRIWKDSKSISTQKKRRKKHQKTGWKEKKKRGKINLNKIKKSNYS